MEDGGATRYTLFAWSPAGYTLQERDGAPPQVGEEIEEGGHTLVVTKIGPSPIPGDSRPCAYSVGK
jgi:hypothetical protein